MAQDTTVAAASTSAAGVAIEADATDGQDVDASTFAAAVATAVPTSAARSQAAPQAAPHTSTASNTKPAAASGSAAAARPTSTGAQGDLASASASSSKGNNSAFDAAAGGDDTKPSVAADRSAASFTADGPISPQPGQIVAPTAQPVAASASDNVSTPVTNPSATVANLSAEIVQKAGQNTTRFDVQLTPDGMGRVDVAVEIDSKGQVTAALSFEKPEAAALVKDGSSELQAALASAGLNLAPDALKISHIQADTASSAANPASGAPVVASQASADSNTNANTGQGGQPSQAHQFATGGQSFQSGSQQHSQQERAAPAFGGLRSFEAGVSAADVIDRQTAYAANLSTRGLDIRI